MKHLGAVLPPLGMAYIAAVLERDGFDVKCIDGPAQATVEGYDIDGLAKDVAEFDPQIVGITASTSQADHAREALKVIKKFNPKIVTILGGTLISAAPDDLLKYPDIDYGVCGEADLAISGIVKKIENGEKLEGSEGLIWREGEGVKFIKAKTIMELDQIPMPARHLLRMDLYKPSPANYRRLPATTMMTSRGCPYACIFCSRPTVGRTFRPHSATRVVDEIEQMAKQFGIRDIQIFDDTFTMDPKRTEDICKGIIERKLDVGWNCMTRVDRITPDLFRLMKQAGCYEVGFGIESGSDRVLKFIKKGITTTQVRNAVKMAKEAGIHVRGFFMIGFPTETKEEILQTITFAKELDVDVAQFMVSTPFPGTELWEMAKKNGKINDEDWNNFTFYAPDKLPFSSDILSDSEIVKLYKYAYKSFYLRPRFMLRQLFGLRTLDDVRRNWMAAKGVLGM